jgi:hypothetical protein
MTLKKFFPVALLTLALGQASGLAGAATNLPAHYPEDFEIIGTLDGINGAEKYIVIDDRAIPLDLSARVYTPSSQFQTLSHLKPGMVIAIKRDHSREAIKEIWVMPKDR